MTEIREAKESELKQGITEIIAYQLDVTPWGASPTSPVVKLYSYNENTRAYTDVSATSLTGTAQVSGNVVTTPGVKSLTEGGRYRLDVQFEISGNTFVAYCWIIGER
jgi:hypothetical protein